MKKLSLKNLKLDAKELLQKDQLKAVFGGYGGNATCSSNCPRAGWFCSTSEVCADRLCAPSGGGVMRTITVCVPR